LVPGIEGAVVKWGLEEKSRLGALSERKTVSLSPTRARGVIREAAERAMGKIGDVEPFRVNPPYKMRIQYTEAKYAEQVSQHEGIEKVDETTVVQVRDLLSELVF